MFGIISQSSPEQMDVIDGGVLDNIPVTRAIRSVAAAAADRPTERWMLFLHPSPEEPVRATADDQHRGVTDRAPAPRPTALHTALQGFTTAAGSETMLDDIEVLRQRNDSAKRYRQLRATQIGRLIKQSPAQAILEAEHSYQGYLHLRP